MSDTLQQDIIFKILKMAKDNSDLSSDELFKQVEAETMSMFNELIKPNEENAPIEVGPSVAQDLTKKVQNSDFRIK